MESTWANLRGPRQLRAHFDAVKRGDVAGPTQEGLAELLGVTPGAVYFWKVGFRRPGPDFKAALHRILDIDPDSWLTAKDHKKVRRARAA